MQESVYTLSKNKISLIFVKIITNFKGGIS